MQSSSYLFFLTVIVATVTPGPSMLLALNHGIRFGTRRTLASASGNAFATALQCAVSLAGLGLILAKTAWVFTLLRYLGAAYLIYLGLTLFFSKSQAPVAGHAGHGRHSLFMEAFVVTLGNPKAIFFFSALFPQFITDGSLTFAKAAWMLLFIVFVTFVSMMLYASLGQRIQGLLAQVHLRRIFDRVIGASFVGLGLGLVWDRK
ncbi:MAG: LysE family translocator [Opitutaceae bacterium]|jgi:threonine/homoserine/homoserine lactone efflux protein